jgi:hypothetical protein
MAEAPTKIDPSLPVYNMRYVQDPLQGLFRNMDSELERKIKRVPYIPQTEELRRQQSMLHAMFRATENSYLAACFLISDVEDCPKRRDTFVLVLPPIIRQVMDTWFNLVYINDDFDERFMDYTMNVYREVRQQIKLNKGRHGHDEIWEPWFVELERLVAVMEEQLPLTPEQKSDPEHNIKPWKQAHGLTEIPSASQPFLQFIDKFIYGDVSIETHLKPSGLAQAAGLLVKNLLPPEDRKQYDERIIHQYKSQQFQRLLIAVLGVLSEIENRCKLGDKEQLVKVWTLFNQLSADGREVYERRYKEMLAMS